MFEARSTRLWITSTLGTIKSNWNPQDYEEQISSLIEIHKIVKYKYVGNYQV